MPRPHFRGLFANTSACQYSKTFMRQIHKILVSALPFTYSFVEHTMQLDNVDIRAVSYRAFRRRRRTVFILPVFSGPKPDWGGTSLLQIVACVLHARLLIERKPVDFQTLMAREMSHI